MPPYVTQLPDSGTPASKKGNWALEGRFYIYIYKIALQAWIFSVEPSLRHQCKFHSATQMLEPTVQAIISHQKGFNYLN